MGCKLVCRMKLYYGGLTELPSLGGGEGKTKVFAVATVTSVGILQSDSEGNLGKSMSYIYNCDLTDEKKCSGFCFSWGRA